MRLTLLGTGAADGWPNPFCSCSSCGWARATGTIRGQTAALIDRDMMLDCGPEAPRAAARLGISLAGVRHLLLTHRHPDHTAPPALLWRSWAQRREPLDLIGPPAALRECAAWIGPTDPVTITPVAAGDALQAGGRQVRVLAADHPDAAVLYEIDRRLLYATDTGPLPAETLAATAGAEYRLVLLELTGCARQHLDQETFPAQLAALRRRGAVTDATRVVAVHLGHRNPIGPELDRRLAGWGAEAVPDGTVLDVAGDQPPRQPRSPTARRPPRRVLILGGARSGKSVEAERRLAAEPDVTYVATGPAPGPDDVDWATRVTQHRARRPPAWRTVETTDLLALLADPPGPLLIDCLPLWLSAHLDDEPAAHALVAGWRDTSGLVVLVSSEVGSGVHPASALGRRFRDALGALNTRLAEVSDEVWLVTAGIARRLA